ncbi:MAG: nuclear transport factor 2 family protein [Acidimicrobiales bacterium]
MTTTTAVPSTAVRLAERLAGVFRSADVGDVFTDDLFLDGHPPLWRFQLEGREAFASWLRGYSPDGADTAVVRVVATEDGIVTELTGRHEEDGVLMTDRKIVLCTVRDGRISEMTIYCSGDWGPELRARHRAETTLLRR